MGLIVPELIMPSTGLTLTDAYVAVSRSAFVITPLGSNVFSVCTEYGTWFSHESRLQEKTRLDSATLVFTLKSGDVSQLYPAVYAHLQTMFPDSYSDETPVEAPAEPPADETPAETPADTPVEEAPAETPADTPAEAPAEPPV
jgi:hypothetical protein